LYRCFAWDAGAQPPDADGPVWFPRAFQGDGRHDNPEAYGCLYLSETPVSCIVEQMARFRGQRISAPLLRRRGLPLALAALELDTRAVLIDLDNPNVLRRERLRPSHVATRHRLTTQIQARQLHERHPTAAGLRWWSTHEASWLNVTLFDRAAPYLSVKETQALTLDEPRMLEAVQFLGFHVR
jgi:RES domain